MSTRETRLHRGRRLGEERVRWLVGELRRQRTQAGLSQRAVAAAVNRSQAEIWRLEHLANVANVSFVEAAELAAVLGYEISIGLHPSGPPIRDRGHQALLGRFRRAISPAFAVAAEVPFPNLGDPRSWDLVLGIPGQRIGVEAETRIRDIQALARRIHQRERDGMVDAIVVVLGESTVNRRLIDELGASLGPTFGLPRRQVLASLRHGRPLPGSGVLLI
jgi:transcriptional regulator with XRE-family HTH domain